MAYIAVGDVMTPPTIADIWNGQTKLEERIELYIQENKRERETLVALATKMDGLAESINKAKGAIWVGWMLGGAFLSLIVAVSGYVVKSHDARIARLEDVTRHLSAPSRPPL
jgi:hypothetical protein